MYKFKNSESQMFLKYHSVFQDGKLTITCLKNINKEHKI